VNPGDKLSIEAEVSNAGTESAVRATWQLVSGELVDDLDVASASLTPISHLFALEDFEALGPQPANLVLQGGSFFGDAFYTMSLTAEFVDPLEIKSQPTEALFQFLVNGPPRDGALIVAPMAGNVLTTFNLTATGWTDASRDLPLSFFFSVQPDAAGGDVLELNPTDSGLTTLKDVNLPAGSEAQDFSVTVILTVRDAFGAEAQVSKVVTVETAPADELISTADDLLVSLSNPIRIASVDEDIRAVNHLTSLAESALATGNDTQTILDAQDILADTAGAFADLVASQGASADITRAQASSLAFIGQVDTRSEVDEEPSFRGNLSDSLLRAADAIVASAAEGSSGGDALIDVQSAENVVGALSSALLLREDAAGDTSQGVADIVESVQGVRALELVVGEQSERIQSERILSSVLRERVTDQDQVLIVEVAPTENSTAPDPSPDLVATLTLSNELLVSLTDLLMDEDETSLSVGVIGLDRASYVETEAIPDIRALVTGVHRLSVRGGAEPSNPLLVDGGSLTIKQNLFRNATDIIREQCGSDMLSDCTVDVECAVYDAATDSFVSLADACTSTLVIGGNPDHIICECDLNAGRRRLQRRGNDSDSTVSLDFASLMTSAAVNARGNVFSDPSSSSPLVWAVVVSIVSVVSVFAVAADRLDKADAAEDREWERQDDRDAATSWMERHHLSPGLQEKLLQGGIASMKEISLLESLTALEFHAFTETLYLTDEERSELEGVLRARSELLGQLPVPLENAPAGGKAEPEMLLSGPSLDSMRERGECATDSLTSPRTVLSPSSFSMQSVEEEASPASQEEGKSMLSPKWLSRRSQEDNALPLPLLHSQSSFEPGGAPQTAPPLRSDLVENRDFSPPGAGQGAWARSSARSVVSEKATGLDQRLQSNNDAFYEELWFGLLLARPEVLEQYEEPPLCERVKAAIKRHHDYYDALSLAPGDKPTRFIRVMRLFASLVGAMVISATIYQALYPNDEDFCDQFDGPGMKEECESHESTVNENDDRCFFEDGNCSPTQPGLRAQTVIIIAAFALVFIVPFETFVQYVVDRFLSQSPYAVLDPIKTHHLSNRRRLRQRQRKQAKDISDIEMAYLTRHPEVLAVTTQLFLSLSWLRGITLYFLRRRVHAAAFEAAEIETQLEPEHKALVTYVKAGEIDDEDYVELIRVRKMRVMKIAIRDSLPYLKKRVFKRYTHLIGEEEPTDPKLRMAALAVLFLIILAGCAYLLGFGATATEEVAEAWLVSFLLAEISSFILLLPLRILITSVVLPQLVRQDVSIERAMIRMPHWSAAAQFARLRTDLVPGLSLILDERFAKIKAANTMSFEVDEPADGDPEMGETKSWSDASFASFSPRRISMRDRERRESLASTISVGELVQILKAEDEHKLDMRSLSITLDKESPTSPFGTLDNAQSSQHLGSPQMDSLRLTSPKLSSMRVPSQQAASQRLGSPQLPAPLERGTDFRPQAKRMLSFDSDCSESPTLEKMNSSPVEDEVTSLKVLRRARGEKSSSAEGRKTSARSEKDHDHDVDDHHGDVVDGVDDVGDGEGEAKGTAASGGVPVAQARKGAPSTGRREEGKTTLDGGAYPSAVVPPLDLDGDEGHTGAGRSGRDGQVDEEEKRPGPAMPGVMDPRDPVDADLYDGISQTSDWEQPPAPEREKSIIDEPAHDIGRKLRSRTAPMKCATRILLGTLAMVVLLPEPVQDLFLEEGLPLAFAFFVLADLGLPISEDFLELLVNCLLLLVSILLFLALVVMVQRSIVQKLSQLKEGAMLAKT